MSFISSQIRSLIVGSDRARANRSLWGSLFAIIVIFAPTGITQGAEPGVGAESVSSADQDFAVVPDSVFLLCEIETFSFGNVGGLGGSECWGWSAPDSSEYAIMGTLNGLTFVNVTTLEVVTTIPGPTIACSKYWRDMRTYKHYCYCVSECSGTNQGLMIVDLQYLPDSVHLVGTFDTSPNGDSTSHNLGIDTVTGFLYIVGKTTFPNPAMHIYDLADPENPTFVGSFGNSPGFHDINVHNDTAYIAEGFTPFFSIYDMSVKTPPTLLARKQIPDAGYVHNIWPTPDRKHVVTTEETANKTVKVWNIEDTANIHVVGEYLGPNNLAHNARIQGDTIYLSHYESGVRLIDISDPTAPTEFSFFETYSGTTVGTFGCWSVYPYLPSGVIFASNRDGRLFILQELTVELADTMSTADASGSVGVPVAVEVSATNSLAVRQILIPFTWAGPLNLTFDSVSTVGTRTELFEEVSQVSFDPFSKRVAYSLVSSTTTDSLDLAPGAGPILTLYFTIPSGAPDSVNPISFVAFNGISPVFSADCPFEIPPNTFGGSISLIPCSNPGDADNSGDVNISDATTIVKYIFQGGDKPPLCDQADADGSGSVDIGDATHIVKFVFQGGAAPSCPSPGNLVCL